MTSTKSESDHVGLTGHC